MAKKLVSCFLLFLVANAMVWVIDCRCLFAKPDFAQPAQVQPEQVMDCHKTAAQSQASNKQLPASSRDCCDDCGKCLTEKKALVVKDFSPNVDFKKIIWGSELIAQKISKPSGHDFSLEIEDIFYLDKIRHQNFASSFSFRAPPF